MHPLFAGWQLAKTYLSNKERQKIISAGLVSRPIKLGCTGQIQTGRILALIDPRPIPTPTLDACQVKGSSPELAAENVLSGWPVPFFSVMHKLAALPCPAPLLYPCPRTLGPGANLAQQHAGLRSENAQIGGERKKLTRDKSKTKTICTYISAVHHDHLLPFASVCAHLCDG